MFEDAAIFGRSFVWVSGVLKGNAAIVGWRQSQGIARIVRARRLERLDRRLWVMLLQLDRCSYGRQFGIVEDGVEWSLCGSLCRLRFRENGVSAASQRQSGKGFDVRVVRGEPQCVEG